MRPQRMADASAMKLDIESGVRGGDPARRHCTTAIAAWPNNFFRLLRGIKKRMPTDSSTGVARGGFSGIYRSLFSRRGNLPTAQGDFLRIAFLDFIRNDWKPDFIDQKLMKRIRAGQSERFIIQGRVCSTVRHRHQNRGSFSGRPRSAVQDLPMGQVGTQVN